MNIKYFLELTLLSAMWGGSFFLTRLSVHELGPVPLTALRAGIAALIFIPIIFLSGHWSTFKKYWAHLWVIGLISTALPFVLISITTKYSTAGFASVLNASMAIFSALIAWFWLKEALSVPAWIGILLGFFGVVVMVADTQSISSDFILLPIITGSLAAFLYALTGNYSRKFLHGISPIALAGGCQFFAALSLSPFALWYWPDQTISVESWMSVIFLGIVCTGIAFIMYFHLLEKIGVANTSLVTYLTPLFAMLWGGLFLAETISLPMTFGALFILTGITLTTGLYKRLRKSPQPH